MGGRPTLTQKLLSMARPMPVGAVAWVGVHLALLVLVLRQGHLMLLLLLLLHLHVQEGSRRWARRPEVLG